MYSYIIYCNNSIAYATLATDQWDAAERFCSFRNEDEWNNILKHVERYTIKQLDGEKHPLSAFVKGVKKGVKNVEKELANTR